MNQATNIGPLVLTSTTPEKLLDVRADDFRHVVTVNAELFVMAVENAEYGAILSKTTNVIDGRVLQLLVSARRRRGLAKLSGSDLIYEMAKHCALTGARLFVVGGSSVVNARACQRLRHLYGDLNVDGYSPPFEGRGSLQWNRSILSRVERFRPEYLAVCLGAPLQETWIAGNQQQLSEMGVRFAIGLGGTADFVAGRVPRAPRLLQRAGLEWLFRLFVEPRRWRRTLQMLKMPYYVLKRYE